MRPFDRVTLSEVGEDESSSQYVRYGIVERFRIIILFRGSALVMPNVCMCWKVGLQSSLGF